MSKILAVQATIANKHQIELQKVFFKFLIGLQKSGHEVVYMIDQQKKRRIYEDEGILRILTKQGIKVIYTGYPLVSEEKNIFKMKKGILDKIDNDFDEIFIYSSKYMNVKAAKKFLDDYKKNNYLEGSYMAAIHEASLWLSIQLILDKQKKNIVIKKYIIDFKETEIKELFPDYKIIQYAYYEDDVNINLPINELFMFKPSNNNLTKKSIKFLFGYIATPWAKREYLSKFVKEKIERNDLFEVYAKDSYSNENTLISQDEYFNKLKKSQFSLVVPATDPKKVSMIRIWECLSLNCIPIILSTVDIEVFKQYKGLYEFFIENHLIYDLENENKTINEFVNKLNYKSLLNKLNNVECIKQIKNYPEMLNKTINIYNNPKIK